MTTHHIGRVVVGALATGLVIAVGLVVGPLAGAEEYVITGAILLAFAFGWALLAALSVLWTRQPQRWALLPAGFMGLAGAALLAFAPGDVVLDALGWIWPPLFLALIVATILRVRAALHSRARLWVVYPLLAVYALCALGGGYETVRASDRRTQSAPGQLIDVGGHRLHLSCAGSGSPTVILESGLGEGAAYWRFISDAVARDTKVCVYDRAGRGWSEPASAPQDGVAIARDLHVLLERASVQAPFVLVGHSSGAQYVRIFAGRYPEQVAGMILLDGQPAEAFEGLPWYPTFYAGLRRVSAVLPSLARLGVGRLLSDPDASARSARSFRDEVVELPTALAQARSFQTLGDRPLVVVTAANGAMAGWFPLQDAMAKLSTNSRHEVVPFEHAELITDAVAARSSGQAICDVVHAVRFAAPLKKS
jgi:pimeloyl-ACP methyl ester carboxylesterase